LDDDSSYEYVSSDEDVKPWARQAEVAPESQCASKCGKPAENASMFSANLVGAGFALSLAMTVSQVIIVYKMNSMASILTLCCMLVFGPAHLFLSASVQQVSLLRQHGRRWFVQGWLAVSCSLPMLFIVDDSLKGDDYIETRFLNIVLSNQAYLFIAFSMLVGGGLHNLIPAPRIQKAVTLCLILVLFMARCVMCDARSNCLFITGAPNGYRCSPELSKTFTYGHMELCFVITWIPAAIGFLLTQCALNRSDQLQRYVDKLRQPFESVL